MSYCRWSTEDFRCDLYAYEHCDGTWTTHVAGSRYVEEVPRLPPIPKPGEDYAEWLAAKRAQSAWLDAHDPVPIGLPHDGETFKDPDLPTFLATLLRLQSVGYYLPEWVLENVRAEIAEGTEAATPVEADPGRTHDRP